MGKNDKNDKNEETALAIADFAIMQPDADSFLQTMKMNLGQHGVTQADLDRVKVPAGGGTSWTIPTLDGDEASKNLDGVIIAWKEPRAYWTESFQSTGGGTPPDCSSEDGETGYGDPGGSCHDCPMSKFGTATKDDGSQGDGQACRQVRLMAILQKDDLVPLLLAAPPTSLANMRKYFLRLASKKTPYFGVVTRFTLEKKRSKGGIDYSEVVPSSIGKLSAEEMARVSGLVETFSKALDQRTTTSDDFHGAGSE